MPPLADDPLLADNPLLAENVPHPESLFDDLVDLDLEVTTECAVTKHEILVSHATLPAKYHDVAKKLDEGQRGALRTVGEVMNDAAGHHRPLPWSHHMEHLVAECEKLKDEAKILQKHDRGDYGLLYQTVDHVSSKLGPLPELTWGIPADSLDEDRQSLEGWRDYKYLHDMRIAIIRMRRHPIYKSAMVEGARVRGPKWVRKQGGQRLSSK
ncbi:hypothetical protein MMC17_005690 [Xylographa soralifera]|nr:hypothetical protein [Xylographa soralifera]